MECGEGMLAVVQGLGDSGLAVTVLDGAQQFTLMPRAVAEQYRKCAPVCTAFRQQSSSAGYEDPARCSARGYEDPARRDARGYEDPARRDTSGTRDPSRCHTRETKYPGRCDSSAQATDDRYATVYRTAHCNVIPTSPPVQLTEFPPQRPELCRGHDNFQVGGLGSGETYVPLSSASVRGGASWSDRGCACSQRPSRETDAFANSLRKYPNISLDRSSEVVERLINYSHIKNQTKSCNSSPPRHQAQNTTTTYTSKEVQDRYLLPRNRNCEAEVSISRKSRRNDDSPTRDCNGYDDEWAYRRQMRNFKEVEQNWSHPYNTTVNPIINNRNEYQSYERAPYPVLNASQSVSTKVQAAAEMVSKEVATVPRIEPRRRNVALTTTTSFSHNQISEGDVLIQKCPKSIPPKVMKSNTINNKVPLRTETIENDLEDIVEDWIKTIPIKIYDVFGTTDKKKVMQNYVNRIKQLINQGLQTNDGNKLRTDLINFMAQIPMLFKVSESKNYVESVVDMLINKVLPFINKTRSRINEHNVNEVNRCVQPTEIEARNTVPKKPKEIPQYTSLIDFIIKSIQDIKREIDKESEEEILTLLQENEGSIKPQAINFTKTLLAELKKNLRTEKVPSFEMNKYVQNVIILQNKPKRCSRQGKTEISDRIKQSHVSSEDTETLHDYMNQLKIEIDNWFSNLNVNIPSANQQSFKETVVNDLAADIVDRHKYLAMNPSSRRTSKDELEFLKYQIFKRINKLVGHGNTETIEHASDLIERIHRIPLPETASFNEPGPLDESACVENECCMRDRNSPLNNKGPSSSIRNEDIVASTSLPNNSNLENLAPNSECKLTVPTIEQLNENYDAFVKDWVNKVPIPESSAEEKAISDKIRTGMYNAIWKAVTKLKLEPATFLNTFAFEDALDDELEELLGLLPQTPELETKKHLLKVELIERTTSTIELIKSTVAPESFRQQLIDNVSINLPPRPVNDCKNQDYKLFEEQQIQKLVDDFILFTKYKPIDRSKALIYRNILVKEIQSLIEKIKETFGKEIKDIDTHLYVNSVLNALHKVLPPDDKILNEEANKVEIDREVEKWASDIPVKSDYEKWQRRKIKNALVKKIQKLDKEVNLADCSGQQLLKDEVSSMLEKMSLPEDESVNIKFMAEELVNRIKNKVKQQQEASKRRKSVIISDTVDYCEFSQHIPGCSSFQDLPTDYSQQSSYVVKDGFIVDSSNKEESYNPYLSLSQCQNNCPNQVRRNEPNQGHQGYIFQENSSTFKTIPESSQAVNVAANSQIENQGTQFRTLPEQHIPVSPEKMSMQNCKSNPPNSCCQKAENVFLDQNQHAVQPNRSRLYNSNAVPNIAAQDSSPQPFNVSVQIPTVFNNPTLADVNRQRQEQKQYDLNLPSPEIAHQTQQDNISKSENLMAHPQNLIPNTDQRVSNGNQASSQIGPCCNNKRFNQSMIPENQSPYPNSATSSCQQSCPTYKQNASNGSNQMGYPDVNKVAQTAGSEMQEPCAGTSQRFQNSKEQMSRNLPGQSSYGKPQGFSTPQPNEQMTAHPPQLKKKKYQNEKRRHLAQRRLEADDSEDVSESDNAQCACMESPLLTDGIHDEIHNEGGICKTQINEQDTTLRRRNYKSVQTSVSLMHITPTRKCNHRKVKSQENLLIERSSDIQTDAFDWLKQIYSEETFAKILDSRLQRLAQALSKRGGEDKMKEKVQRYLNKVYSQFSQCNDERPELTEHISENIIKKLKRLCFKSDRNSLSRVYRLEIPKHDHDYEKDYLKRAINDWLHDILISERNYTDENVINDDLLKSLLKHLEPHDMNKVAIYDILQETPIASNDYDRSASLSQLTATLIKQLEQLNKIDDTNYKSNDENQNINKVSDFVANQVAIIMKKLRLSISTKRLKFLEEELADVLKNYINSNNSKVLRTTKDKVYSVLCNLGGLTSYQAKYFADKMLKLTLEEFDGNEMDACRNQSEFKTETKLNLEEQNKLKSVDDYKQKVKEQIKEWFSEMTLHINLDKEALENLLDNLTEDIIDRSKYLELNPTSKEHELRYLKYQIFKWTNKMTESYLQIIENAQDLMDRLNKLNDMQKVEDQFEIIDDDKTVPTGNVKVDNISRDMTKREKIVDVSASDKNNDGGSCITNNLSLNENCKADDVLSQRIEKEFGGNNLQFNNNAKHQRFYIRKYEDIIDEWFDSCIEPNSKLLQDIKRNELITELAVKLFNTSIHFANNETLKGLNVSKLIENIKKSILTIDCKNKHNQDRQVKDEAFMFQTLAKYEDCNNEMLGEENKETVKHDSELLNLKELINISMTTNQNKSTKRDLNSSINTCNAQPDTLFTNRPLVATNIQIVNQMPKCSQRVRSGSTNGSKKTTALKRQSGPAALGIPKTPKNHDEPNILLEELNSLPPGMSLSETYEYFGKIFIESIHEIPLETPTPEQEILANLARSAINNGIWKTFFALKGNPDIEDDYDLFEFALEERLDELLDCLPQTEAVKQIRPGWKSKMIHHVILMLKYVHYITDPPTFRELVINKLNRKWLKDYFAKQNDMYQQQFVAKVAEDFIVLSKYKESDPIKAGIYRQRLMKRLEALAEEVKKQYNVDFGRLNMAEMCQLGLKVLEDVPLPKGNTLDEEVNEILTADEIRDWYRALPLKPVANQDEEALRERLCYILAQRVCQLEKQREHLGDPTLDTNLKREVSRFLQRDAGLTDVNDLNLNYMVEELTNRLKNRRQNNSLGYESFEKDKPFSSTFAQSPGEVLAPLVDIQSEDDKARLRNTRDVSTQDYKESNMPTPGTSKSVDTNEGCACNVPQGRSIIETKQIARQNISSVQGVNVEDRMNQSVDSISPAAQTNTNTPRPDLSSVNAQSYLPTYAERLAPNPNQYGGTSHGLQTQGHTDPIISTRFQTPGVTQSTNRVGTGEPTIPTSESEGDEEVSYRCHCMEHVWKRRRRIRGSGHCVPFYPMPLPCRYFY